MVKIVDGDLLKAKENIICHQCNTEGLFGGGLAYSIKQFYPICEKQTMEFVNVKKDNLLGNYYLYVKKKDNKIIANCFTQNEDYTTNYEALKKCFTKLKENCIDMKQTIAIPYNYGCGIANGNWDIVYKIIEDIFNDYDVTLYRLQK